MSKFVTMLIAGLFVAGNAVAQTTTTPAPAKSPAAATPATPATPAAPAASAKPGNAPVADTKAAPKATKGDAKADSKADAKKATPETGKK